MSMQDRDWYRQELRERAQREREAERASKWRPGSYSGGDVPWRGIVAALVALCVLAVALDVRSVGAPLTGAGVSFWWKVRTGSR